MSYRKLIDLLNELEKIDSKAIEICTCSLTPFYLDSNATYEIYHHELQLNLVNEPMFEKYISMLFRKHSNEIEPYLLNLHTTCFIESILPGKEVNVSDIINWINYVIEENTNDLALKKTIKQYFNDDHLDINKLYFELFIHNKYIYSIN